MVPWWRIAVFAAFALPITFFDLKEMRIPDVLSLGGIAVFVALGILVPGGSVITVAREALIGFGVFWAITIATGGKLGLGDAKYSVLIALSLGLYGWLTTIAVASVTGLAAGLMLVLHGGFPRDARIPFAPFLTLGAAVSIATAAAVPGGAPHMKGTTLALALAVLAAAAAPAQQIREIEFRNQPITDILIALAEMAGRSIVPDETVSGNASYYFTSMDFETALQVFLSTYKLRSWREGAITYVSRVFAQYNRAAGTVTVDADDVDLRLIVRALSRAIGKTILFDTLPKESLTVHAADAAPAAVLAILMRRFPDYTVETDKDFFYVRKPDAASRPAGGAAAAAASLVSVDRGQYSIDVERARFRDILVDLFRKAGLEYSLFLRTDVILENLHFSGKSRDEMLRLVMEQANADYTVENGIWYVYDIQRTDVLKKLKTVRQIPLSHVAAQDLPGLFPQELASQNLYRLDKGTNSVILTGSEEEIGPIEEFIRAIDQPTGGKSWCLFTLDHLKVSDLAAILPSSLGGTKPIALPQSNSFVMLLSPGVEGPARGVPPAGGPDPECVPDPAEIHPVRFPPEKPAALRVQGRPRRDGRFDAAVLHRDRRRNGAGCCGSWSCSTGPRPRSATSSSWCSTSTRTISHGTGNSM